MPRSRSRSASIATLLALALALGVPRAPARAADNSPPEGFVALFNGKDLAGWKGLVESPPRRAVLSEADYKKAQEAADQRMREHWTVQDGALVFDGKGDSLCTAKDYGDFELLVDWKILPRGDSGIYLRGSPQVQIWEDPVGSGGLYNNQKNPSKPLVKADRPVGEWNSFRIRMVGEKVTIHLNGQLVVDDVVLENYWERDRPIYPTGQIELQNHGNTLWFKNVYIREIPRAYPAEGAKAPVVKKGDRVAIVGDSITEQKLYSRFLEDYLVACVSDLDLQVVQLGWSGERAPGFEGRMENDLLPFRPNVVTTCYGMNDGSYRAYEPAIGKAYADSMRAIVARLKEKGIVTVVGSPGAVDTFTFRNPNAPPRVYNANLARLRDLARDLAREAGMPFANVHEAMAIAMERAKPVLGEAYDVCGGDGFHPRPNGHLVMAYAFLRAMGFDGHIGTISADWGGAASATDGHKVVSFADGTVEVESSRYPFCFQGDPKSPDGTRSIVPFLPFNEDLNRLVLVVKALPSARAAVTWGGATRSFTKEELERGVNLSSAFVDSNPLAEAFRKVDEAVARKQSFETPAIKEVIHRFRLVKDLLPDDPQAAAAVEALSSRFVARQAALSAEVRALVQPVRHAIRIVPE